MSEEQKELLKEKLKTFFDEKLNLLTNKFETDINTIESYMFSYFDNVILPFREIEEKEKEKEKQEDPKEKEDKKDNEKHFKKLKPLTKENANLSKTPLRPIKKKEIFKEKTELHPKNKTKIFGDKDKKTEKKEKKEKSEKSELNTTLPSSKFKKKNPTTMDVSKKERPSKTPLNKRGKKTDEDKDIANKSKNLKTASKRNPTKKFTDKGKTTDKKGKKDNKKNAKKEEDTKKEEKEEEKKVEIILKDKAIFKIPDELKEKNALFNIYLVLKGNYLTNREKYNMFLYNPTIYKLFGNDISFLLDDKKKEIKAQISELESFLNNYGDLESYLAKEFSASKTALNSLVFVKRDEIENILTKGNFQAEINDIFKILLYIFDIPFDENLENENLINFFMSEVMDKNGVKELKSFTTNYISKNKDLNITKEKYDKIHSIIVADDKVLSSMEIIKICRSISYCTLLIREINEFMNYKTLDEVPIYELKLKNKRLKELKYKLATLENKGVPPKEPQKEEKKQENDNPQTNVNKEVREENVPKENVENKQENDNVQNNENMEVREENVPKENEE